IGVALRIIYDTQSTSKTLAYLLLVVFLPLAGAIIYFSVGVNYRKKKIYSRKLKVNTKQLEDVEELLNTRARANMELLQPEAVRPLATLLLNDSSSPFTLGNKAKLLVNGEEKFPELFAMLDAAEQHIHLEYYIVEPGAITDRMKEILLRKASEGVQVRFIYDDFGSRSIRGRWVKELIAGGVEAHPFSPVRLLLLANRLNYRNHHKLVVVDGKSGLIGGINLSDRYTNASPAAEQIYWRDTHLRVDGEAVHHLQHAFLCNWNFCARQNLQMDRSFFPELHGGVGDTAVQMAISGPDSPTETIMLSLMKAIASAKERILITTPYFIPGDSILDALRVAALSGVRVQLLVPGNGDSWLVNHAARSFYGELMEAGADVFLYRKGFMHAKTMVVDRSISVIGTANMDQRSFHLNFEMNALIYGSPMADELASVFANDLLHAERIDPERWRSRPDHKILPERVARLLSPLM
ncbi:MAG: cardiolipin synthase, partial [Flavobacteriales bacterium]